MDKSLPVIMNGEAREWSPAVGLVVCTWLLFLAAAGWLTATLLAGSEPAAVLMAGLAVAGSGVAAAFVTRCRPRLRADADGLTVGGLLGARHHPWPLVRGVRVFRMRRLGRTTSLLEIDTVSTDGDEHLLVFGRLELAADPEDVLPALEAIRP